MTKRRWFVVCLFLIGLVWSYTLGPDLSRAHIWVRHLRRTHHLDPSTIEKEGSPELIDELFKPYYFLNYWLFACASHFGYPSGIATNTDWSPYESVVFVDGMSGRIYTWSDEMGTDYLIESDSKGAGGYSQERIDEWAVKQNAIYNESVPYPPVRGPLGLVTHPTNPKWLFVAQSWQRRVVRVDRTDLNAEPVIILDDFNGNALNGPTDLTIDPTGMYLFVSDSSQSNVNSDCALPTSIYQVNLDGNGLKTSVSALKIDESLNNPRGLDLNKDGSTLFVANCNEGTLDIRGIDLKSTENKEIIAWTQKRPNGQEGCTHGVANDPRGFVYASCPGGRICIFKENGPGSIEASIKFPDSVITRDLFLTEEGLYVTSQSSLYKIRLNL